MAIFEAWEDECGITFTTQENILDHKNRGLLSKEAKFLHQIQANSYEKAMVVHHQKMGWEPYKVMRD